MRRVRFVASALAAIVLVALAVSVPVRPATAAAGTAKAGIVYLFRGGANVFSTGMDELADMLRAQGIEAKSVNHRRYRELAREARDLYAEKPQPIVIVGHSFGANAAVAMATDLLASGTPVALIVTYDCTYAYKVPQNVARVINFYSTALTGMGLKLEGTPRFRGAIDNIEVTDFNHYNIDNAARLHDETVAAILKVLR